MKRIILTLIAALALAIPAAAQAAQNWSVNRVQTVEGAETAIQGFGKLKIENAASGTAECRVEFGGNVYNVGVGAFGAVEELVLYNCEDRACEGGFEQTAISVPFQNFGIVATGSEVGMTGFAGGGHSASITCSGVTRTLKPWTMTGSWTNGTMIGAAPSYWQVSTTAEATDGAQYQFSGKLRLFGLEGMELITRR